jgi:hypothetical protein
LKINFQALKIYFHDVKINFHDVKIVFQHVDEGFGLRGEEVAGQEKSLSS